MIEGILRELVSYPLELAELKRVHVVLVHHLESGHVGPAIHHQVVHLVAQNAIPHELLQHERRHD